MEPSLDEVLERAVYLDDWPTIETALADHASMSPLRFRNLDFDSYAPLDEWPAEAIETLMDRGMLSDWRRLAEAIRRNPWGPAARTAENVASWGEHYGVDALMIRVIGRAREEVARPETHAPGR